MNYDMFEKEEGFNPVKEEYYEIENITDYFKIPVSKEDIPFVKLACLANKIRYIFRSTAASEDGIIAYIFTNVNRKEEILKDIACEKQSAEEYWQPVYSKETIANPEKLRTFQDFNQTYVYGVLREDADNTSEEDSELFMDTE